MQHIINTYTLIFGESKMLSDACRFEELEVPFGGVKPADRGPPAGRVSTEERTTKYHNFTRAYTNINNTY